MSYDATWCPICDKQVSSKCRDTNELLQHIRKCHSTKSSDNPEYQEPEVGLNVREELLEKKICKVPTCSTDGKAQRRVYATRVDTWKRHSERKICPKCQREVRPTLHSRGNKLTTTHVAALWLLGCWPFCFAPLMTKKAKKFRMVCPLCGYLYGIFEDTNNGLSARTNESEDLHARLSSPPDNFRELALRDTLEENSVACSVCYHKLHKSRSRLSLLKNKINRLSHPELISRNASMSMRKKKIFSTKVETWKWHSRRLLCPSCNQESAPLISVKQHKFTSSHLGALCLLGSSIIRCILGEAGDTNPPGHINCAVCSGAICVFRCWPLCFMPLTTSRDKRTRMVCPVCGYDYGTRVASKCSLVPSCGKQLPVMSNPVMRKFTENKSTTCFGYPERKLHFEQIPINIVRSEHKYDIMESGCRSRNNLISSGRNLQCHQHQFMDGEQSECQFCRSRSIPKLHNDGMNGHYDYDYHINNANYYYDNCNQ